MDEWHGQPQVYHGVAPWEAFQPAHRNPHQMAAVVGRVVHGKPVQKSNSAAIGKKRNAVLASVFLPMSTALHDRHSAEPAGWDN